jgi:hypothetical protein
MASILSKALLVSIVTGSIESDIAQYEWITPEVQDRICFLYSNIPESSCISSLQVCSHDSLSSCSQQTVADLASGYEKRRAVVVAAATTDTLPFDFMRLVGLPFTEFIWANKIVDHAGFQSGSNALVEYFNPPVPAIIALIQLYLRIPGTHWRIGSYPPSPSMTFRQPSLETMGGQLFGLVNGVEARLGNRVYERALVSEVMGGYLGAQIAEPMRAVQSSSWLSRLYRMTGMEHERFHLQLLAAATALETAARDPTWSMDPSDAAWLYNMAYTHSIASRPATCRDEREYTIRLETTPEKLQRNRDLLSTPNFFTTGIAVDVPGVAEVIDQPVTTDELMDMLAGLVHHGDLNMQYKYTLLRQWQLISVRLFGREDGTRDAIWAMIPTDYQSSIRYITPKREHYLETITWTMSAIIASHVGATRTDWTIVLLRVLRQVGVEGIEIARIDNAGTARYESVTDLKLSKWTNISVLARHAIANYPNFAQQSVVSSVHLYASVIANVLRYNGNPQVEEMMRIALEYFDSAGETRRSVCPSGSCFF